MIVIWLAFWITVGPHNNVLDGGWYWMLWGAVIGDFLYDVFRDL